MVTMEGLRVKHLVSGVSVWPSGIQQWRGRRQVSAARHPSACGSHQQASSSGNAWQAVAVQHLASDDIVVGSRCQAAFVLRLASAWQAAGARRLTSGVWHLAYGAWHLASGIWRMASGIWRLASGDGLATCRCLAMVWQVAGVWLLRFGIQQVSSVLCARCLSY